MPYDSSLDATVSEQKWENGTEKITVSVRSYNNGPKKLQISRESQNSQGEFRFSKLGRLTKEETEAVLPMINEAAKQM
ncbi:MAG: hypothetical protein ABIG55_00940 [Candidatus Omnitrophota bacterium]|nr:hypothetical protein [Candidatus Omnitrophota bacterium]